MRRIILVASLLAVIELAGSSILNHVGQHRVNTKKVCVEEGSALKYELDESIEEVCLKCEILEDGLDIGKYLDYDPITDYVTCKQNAPEKCKAAVQELGTVWNRVWLSVPDPTTCEEYEYVNTLVKSCK